MDPFSIATGVLGLLGTGAAVIKFLDTVKSTIQDAPKTVAWALAEVSDVHSAIARLQGLFEHIDSIPEDARAMVTVQDAAVTVTELITSFDDLVDVLKPFGLSDPALMTTWDKAKWARRQDDVAKVIMRIQTRKTSLSLMLNIFQCESDIVAVQSRLALETGINTVIEGNIDIQQRLERMERRFEACIINIAPSRKMLGYAGTHSDAVSVRSSSMTLRARQVLAPPEAQRPSTAVASSVVEALGPTQDAGHIPVIKLEFEETLAESGVYRRVQRPFDALSILSSDDRSITRTIMTTYSLADNASVLSRYPIIDRTDLRHPEFYAAVENERTRESRLLSAIVPRRRSSSDTRASSQRSVPQRKVRTPPNCGPDVMGAWSVSTKRIWRATEFRFETLFEVPVIFVCPTSNTRGPLKDKPVYFVDGTRQSLQQTGVRLPWDEQMQMQSLQGRREYTDDNERASWVTLLSHLQSMERGSQEWQRNHYQRGPPQSQPLAGFEAHTLAVAVQAKKRSWDTMPADVKKPYATTAFCHLLEMAAMMGIYWKEFDRLRERYQAEGNGYTLTGAPVPDLGLLFTFQIYGKSKFQENRVIPVDEVKELCCGFVTTLFREKEDRRRIEFPNEEPKDLSFLQLGSKDEIAKSMVLIDCNTDTANYFRSNDAQCSHLFPVPFELLGMLGKTLHIRNSAFRMLPNPTPYRWDKSFFDLRQLVREYRRHVTDPDLTPVPQDQQPVEDTELLVQALEVDKKSRTPGYSMRLLDTLHDILDRCDSFLKESDRDLVRMVIREHFQEVLQLINAEEEVADKDGESLGGFGREREEHFSNLTAASPELRQEVFMELYFYRVFPRVRERAVRGYERRQANQYTPSMHVHIQLPDGVPQQDLDMATTTLDTVTNTLDTVTNTLDSGASVIWCTLVLRMMCWLLLHDFDRKDVQIPKSELLGSRLSVYIA